MDNKEPLLKDEEETIFTRDTEIANNSEPLVKEEPVIEPVTTDSTSENEVVSEPIIEEPVVKESNLENETTSEPITEETVMKESTSENKTTSESNLTEESPKADAVKNEVPIMRISEKRAGSPTIALVVTIVLTVIVGYLLFKTCQGFYYGFRYRNYNEQTTTEQQP